MNWPVLVGSLAAIVLLGGLARLLKLGGAPIADAAEAQRIARELLSGFDPRSAVVGVDGTAALVFGSDGIAFVRRHGAHFIARRIDADAAVSRNLTRITIGHRERSLGPFVIALETEVEARELTSMLGRSMSEHVARDGPA